MDVSQHIGQLLQINKTAKLQDDVLKVVLSGAWRCGREKRECDFLKEDIESVLHVSLRGHL